MKGVVFTILSDMVIDQMGMETWDALLEQVELPSGGAYTSGGLYDDAELFSLVGALSEHSGIPAQDLVKAYGNYAFARLAERSPVPVEPDKMSLQDFLLSLNDVIHTEVKKLYPDADLPNFGFEQPDQNTLVMVYDSHRKLCALCEGLVEGAAAHFDTEIAVSQSQCMHDGAENCRIVVQFSPH